MKRNKSKWTITELGNIYLVKLYLVSLEIPKPVLIALDSVNHPKNFV